MINVYYAGAILGLALRNADGQENNAVYLHDAVLIDRAALDRSCNLQLGFHPGMQYKFQVR